MKGRILKIEDVDPSSEWVYDLSVDDNHNFFANGILTHNSDGLQNAFFFSIGRILSKSDRRDMKPKIYFMNTKVNIRIPKLGNGKVNRARVLNMLAGIDSRNALVAREVIRAVNADRRIMVLSDRLEMLYHLRRIIKQHDVPDDRVGWVIGAHWTGFDPDDPPATIRQQKTPYGPAKKVLNAVKKIIKKLDSEHDIKTKSGGIRISNPGDLPSDVIDDLIDMRGVIDAERDVKYLYLYTKRTGGQPKTKRIAEDDLQEAQKRQVILATFGLAAEGLDVPELDVLLLATPRSDVEQPVGRALRILPEKKQPIIVDFVDAAPYFHRLKGARRRQYKRLGYDLAEVGR